MFVIIEKNTKEKNSAKQKTNPGGFPFSFCAEGFVNCEMYLLVHSAITECIQLKYGAKNEHL